MKVKQNSSGGFTIIELMVSTIAFAVMVLAVGSMLVFGYTAWTRGNSSVEMQRDVSLAMRVIAKEIRMANIDDVITSVPSELTCSTPDGSRSTTFTKNGGSLDASGSVDMQLIRDGVGLFAVNKNPTNGVVSVIIAVNVGTDRTVETMQIVTRNKP